MQQADNKIVVAIWMVTYNHENYIEQAVESVMSQQTSFAYKLFIGEDFSTDKTRSICLSLKEKYPDKIELLIRDKNIGAEKNGEQVYKACFGSGAKYLAMLEGDDYWVDNNKLQKQVDFLEKNSDFSMVFHDIEVRKGTKLEASGNKLTKDVFDLYDYAREGFVHTSTILYRNFGYENMPKYMNDCYAGDSVLIIAIAKRGLIKYIPEVMSVYRLHETGIWSMKDKTFLIQKRVSDIDVIMKHEGSYDSKLKDILKGKLFKEYRFLWGATKKAKYYFKALTINPVLTLKLSLKGLVG